MIRAIRLLARLVVQLEQGHRAQFEFQKGHLRLVHKRIDKLQLALAELLADDIDSSKRELASILRKALLAPEVDSSFRQQVLAIDQSDAVLAELERMLQEGEAD